MGKFAIVDKDVCIACGSCNECAPEIFNYDDEGRSLNILDNNSGVSEIPESLFDDLEDAKDGCPVECIKVAEKPFDGDPFKFDY